MGGGERMYGEIVAIARLLLGHGRRRGRGVGDRGGGGRARGCDAAVPAGWVVAEATQGS